MDLVRKYLQEENDAFKAEQESPDGDALSVKSFLALPRSEPHALKCRSIYATDDTHMCTHLLTTQNIRTRRCTHSCKFATVTPHSNRFSWLSASCVSIHSGS